MLLDQSVQGSEGSFIFRPIRQKVDSGVPVLLRMGKVIVSGILLPSSPKQKKGRRTPGDRLFIRINFNLTKKNLFELKTFHFNKKNSKNNNKK